MSDAAPDQPIFPTEPPYGSRWTDWSVPAWVSVNARSPEEAHERVEYVVRRVNEFLAGSAFKSDADGMILPGAIVQRQDDRLPEES